MMMNTIIINPQKLSEDFFKMHCDNLSQISEIVLYTQNNERKQIRTYDELSAFFPHLPDEFKNKVIQKYHKVA